MSVLPFAHLSGHIDPALREVRQGSRSVLSERWDRVLIPSEELDGRYVGGRGYVAVGDSQAWFCDEPETDLSARGSGAGEYSWEDPPGEGKEAVM